MTCQPVPTPLRATVSPLARVALIASRLRAASLTLVASLLLNAPAAHTQSLADARVAYAEGRLLEAARVGEALETSDGLAVAAMSLAVYAFYESTEEEWRDVVERAIRLAEAAVEADPENAEAHFQLAHARGRYAQGVGTLMALREGLAGKIREPLEASLAIRPDDTEVLVALGGWHADVAAEGRVARWMYGGDRDEAIRLMERAVELEPESKIVLYSYGSRLAELDEENGVERARAMLEKALSIVPRDYYEDYIHLEILDELDALNRGQP